LTERVFIGVLLLTWGLFAVTLCGHIATNRRGFNDVFTQTSLTSGRMLAFLKFQTRVTAAILGLIGVPVFAFGGAIALGLVDPVDAASPTSPPMEWHPINAVIAAGMLIMIFVWLPRRPMFRAAQRHGRFARQLMYVVYGSSTAMALGLGIASLGTFLIGWTIGALAISAHIWLGHWRPERPPPQQADDATHPRTTKPAWVALDDGREPADIEYLHDQLVNELSAAVAQLRDAGHRSWANWLDVSRRQLTARDRHSLEHMPVHLAELQYVDDHLMTEQWPRLARTAAELLRSIEIAERGLTA
jgi:hypothetical protein